VNVKKGKTCAQANRLEDFGERGEEKAGQGRGWCGKKGEETFFMERKMQFSENSERMDVRYVAALARIALEEGEAQRLEGQMSDILKFVGELKELDVEGVEGTEGASEEATSWHEDVEREGLEHVVAMGLAPEERHGQFAVPKIIE
jgi:aspartyl-tRNA(Asn)/glutamyl-tRNA(Gln) amidotransferase subunit C